MAMEKIVVNFNGRIPKHEIGLIADVFGCKAFVNIDSEQVLFTTPKDFSVQDLAAQLKLKDPNASVEYMTEHGYGIMPLDDAKSIMKHAGK